MAYPWAPATADVARLIADRVLDANDVPATDFGAGTIPTATQVTALIAPVAEEVHAAAGDIPTTGNVGTGEVAGATDLVPLATFVTAQGVAAWVLNSWFSEDPQGPELQRIYETNRDRLAKAVLDVWGSGKVGAGDDIPLPVYGFPSADNVPQPPITTLTTNF